MRVFFSLLLLLKRPSDTTTTAVESVLLFFQPTTLGISADESGSFFNICMTSLGNQGSLVEVAWSDTFSHSPLIRESNVL
jgi:hypothetical protein